MPGVVEASVNLTTSTASVTWLKGTLSRDVIANAITKADYQATPLDAQNISQTVDDKREAEADTLRRDTLIAAALALPVFIIEMGGHFMPQHGQFGRVKIDRQASWMLQWVLTTIVLLWPGRRFLREGFPSLLRGAPEMSAFVALGTAAAWLFSTVALFAPTLLSAGSRALFFEAAAVTATLILFGRWLEARSKLQTGSPQRADCARW